MRTRLDGWKNVLAGIGRKQDKTESSYFVGGAELDSHMLTDLWMHNGLAKRIVALKAGDMVRSGWEINGDPEGLIDIAFERLDVKSKLIKALEYMRLYGGSAILLQVRDGRKLSEPIGEGEVEGLKVYSQIDFQYDGKLKVTDPASPYFDDFEHFYLDRPKPVQIHASRLLLLKGEEIPQSAGGVSGRAKYWGLSALQAPYDRLSEFGVATKGVANLMLELSIGKIRISNLEEIVGEDNTAALWNRMEIINATKSVINAVLLGQNEDYMRDNLALSGVPEVLDRWMMMIASETGYPVTRLFGRSAGGLNATGEHELTTYYDEVESERQDSLAPVLRTLLQRVAQGLKIEEEVSFDFSPLYTPSLEQTIKMRKDQMEIDRGYIDLGVLSEAEIRLARFVNGFSHTTSVDSEEIEWGEE